MKKQIYLDEASSGKTFPEVFSEMKKYYLEEYGNPSSLHEMGENVLKEINSAREKLSKEIGAKPWEIYFTSGGTEADNLAIQGTVRANSEKKKIIISSIEHAAVNETCNYLEKKGYEIVRIGVNREGLLNLDELRKQIDGDTLLVSVMHANNIIGVVQDLESIGKICKEKRVLFHTDAVQSFGKIKADVKKMNVSLLSASAHKIHGPKGIGFLYVKEGVKLEPLIFGGGQEKNLRSGTENVPAIAGFSKALEVFRKKINQKKSLRIRELLMDELEKIGGRINGSREKRTCDNVHVSFSGIDNATLVAYLSKKGIYVSSGSACESKKEKEDHVLKALGLSSGEIKGSMRITFGENFNEKDVFFVVREIKKAVGKLRI